MDYFVSVIIPCRNEDKFIARCLDSVVATDYPKDRLEVMVVDGMSEDHTRSIVQEYSQRYPFIRLVANPRKIPAAAFNTGVRAAHGNIIALMSAHSTFPNDYLWTCVHFLRVYQADNVGGVLKFVPRVDTLAARAIALTLANPFASGNAHAKIGARAPRWADTAAFGFYRKEAFARIGLFDEQLAGSSDLDLNSRLRDAGGKILLVPKIEITYFPDSDFGSFWWHNFADGVWATYVLKFRSKAWRWRHWVPLAFVLSLIGSAGLSIALPVFRPLFLGTSILYIMTSIRASMNIWLRERDVALLLPVMLAFAIRHIAHGLGALWGLLLLLLPGVQWKGRRGRSA